MFRRGNGATRTAIQGFSFYNSPIRQQSDNQYEGGCRFSKEIVISGFYVALIG
jgi:hypothetical protein